MSSFLPFLIFLAILVHSVLRKKTRGFFILTNLMIQQVICLVLKKIIAQSRPHGACSSSYGYPSGHSGFAASLSTWLILEAFLLHEKVPFKSSKLYIVLRNSFVSLAPFIPVSRYFLNYHSVEQICCGILAGFLSSMIYFWVVMTSVVNIQEGKYNGSVAKIWEKYRFQDDIISYTPREGLLMEKRSLSEDDAVETKEESVHPLKHNVKAFLQMRKIKSA